MNVDVSFSTGYKRCLFQAYPLMLFSHLIHLICFIFAETPWEGCTVLERTDCVPWKQYCCFSKDRTRSLWLLMFSFVFKSVCNSRC